MSAREGTRRRRISVLHMLGTWEGKIEGCNCPSCKECSGKGIPEAAVLSKSPPKSPKGSRPVVKVGPKSKVIDSEVTQEENSAKDPTVKEVISDIEIYNSEFATESADGEKSSSISSDKSETMQQPSEESGVDNEHKTVSHSVEVECETQDLTSEKPLQKKRSLSHKDQGTQDKSKQKAERGTGKSVVIAQRCIAGEDNLIDQSTIPKQRRITTDETMLDDPVMIKQEPEEYLSDLDDSDKPTRGRYSDRGKGESRSSRRARMVTSEMENIYAKPRMIFTGRGVVRKFEPGIDRTPKSKRGRKPGKALLPVNVKQEPKDTEAVKQEVEGNDLDELQKALSEAAENISGMGEELLDAFHELGESTKKIKQKKKPTTPFFKRLEGEGDKYVECNICFKVLKESSMKQHYKTHTGEKPHMCDICQSRFTRKGDVERHKRLVHKSQKPFKCQKCTKEFSDRKNLKAHLQNHDKAIYYGCSTCGFKFGKREYYENHIRYIHPLPDGAVPAFSAVDDDLATKQLKQLEMEEQKERIAQKGMAQRESELEDFEEEEEDEEEEEEEEEEDEDDDDMDDEDKAIEITVTDMDEQKLFPKSGILVNKEDKEDSMDGASTNTQEDDEDEEEEEEEEESNVVISAAPVGRQRSEVPTNSSLMHLFKNNTSHTARLGTNMKVSKGMLSLTQTITDNDSQEDEDLVNKVIAAAVSQATDTIESLQAKSGANMSGNDIAFGDEDETEEEERLDGADDLQEILGGPSYEMLPFSNVQKPAQQPAEIHITASVSGQQRKFIIQVPPGTNLNVQTPEGMEMIVNIVNQLCAGKGELDGPIEVVMKSPSNRLMFVNNKR